MSANIENNVPIPEANKKASKRGRRKITAPEKENSAAGLIKALQFISLAQKSVGTIWQTHCLLNNKWCVAFDGVLTIGCKIEEDISACPRTDYFLKALQQCGAQIAVTQLSQYILSIKSNKFKASIPCVDFASVPATAPDASQSIATSELRAALDTCAWLVREGEERAHRAAVLLQTGSAVGTNGHVILEHWHGLSLPAPVLIPKAAITALQKIAKPLKSYGCSPTTATFYFEDDSFLKTQLFDDIYPNYKLVFDDQPLVNSTILPSDFYDGIKTVQEFSESKFVFLTGDKIQSHMDEEQGATFELDGIPNGYAFNYEYLNRIMPHFNNTIFANDRVYFRNGAVRGVLCGGTHYKQ